MANMEKVYEELNPQLRAKLEETTLFTIRWPISQLLETYNIPIEKADEVCDICRKHGLTINTYGNEKYVVLYKPTVLINPLTNVKSLQAHLDLVPGIYKQVGKEFVADYKGKEWKRLRVYWRFPTLSFLFAPLKLVFHDRRMIHKLKQRHVDFKQKMLKHVVGKSDVAELANSLRNNFSAFSWKLGDILLIDNTKIAHAGMPGDRSPRVIRAMICNALKFDYSYPGTGAQTVKTAEPLSLGDILSKFTMKVADDVEQRVCSS